MAWGPRFTLTRWSARLIGALLLLSLTAAPRIGSAQGNGAPLQWLSAGCRPYTQTLQQMARQDFWTQYQIQQGWLPRPPLFRSVPNPSLDKEEEEEEKERVPRPAEQRRDQRPGAQRRIAAPAPPGLGAALLSRPMNVGASFPGVNLQQNSGWFPPDTMGAIGPDHFVEIVNGAVAVFNRTGTRLSIVSLDSFFTFVSGGITYPRSHAFDPRVLYDRRSGRWFACTLDFGVGNVNNHILLSVSRTADPTGTWDKYVVPVGEASSFTDFDTLGVDDNGVYFGMGIFTNPGYHNKIAVTQKAPLLAPSPTMGTVFVTGTDGIEGLWSSPQPVLNMDPVGPNDPAWFVTISPFFFGNVNYVTLTWSGGVPSISSYSEVITPEYAYFPPDAPARGSTMPVNTSTDQMTMAVIRNGSLWTCHTVGIDQAGGNSTADRDGVEWFQLAVSGASLSLTQSGRVWDSAAADPRFYYYPSLGVNGQGHLVLGFSGSKNTEYIGAYACSRLAGDAPGTTSSVRLLKAGETNYTRSDGSRNRWGDYSYTSLDPNDDMSLWTIQEYAASPAHIWGTWIDKLLSPAPTLVNPNGSGCAGQAHVTLALIGTGFYDPGSGYPNRLTVALTGGTINGISNYQVTYTSPTSVTVTFDIASNATLGARSLALTNPDGQSVTVANAFTINRAALIGQVLQPGYTNTNPSEGMKARLYVFAADSTPQSESDALQTVDVYLDPSGNFGMPTGVVANGTYRIGVRPLSSLGLARLKAGNVTLSAGTTPNLGSFTCPIGDTNRDGYIDDVDLGIVIFYQGGVEAGADLNGDGIVDDVDLSLVVLNQGLAADFMP